MTLTVKNRKYVLSSRRASDVLALAAAIRGHESDNATDAIAVAKIVNDSLKSTGARLGWLRGLRYWRFRLGLGITFLIKHLSVQDIVKAYADVLELEGGSKKKLEQLVNQSAETSPGI